MPRGDRTGPMGMGPMTGRGAGLCAGSSVPGFMNALPARGGMGMRRGRNRGCGMGMGWRHGWGFQGVPPVYQPVPSPQPDELTALKAQAKYIGETLQSINSRISAIEAEK